MTLDFSSNGIQFNGSGGGGGTIVTTDGVQTLTNKTLNAKNNTIQDLGIENFEDGVVRTSVRDVDEASDSKLVTEKAVAEATKTFIFDQAMASDTWVISHNVGKYPSVSLVDSAGTKFMAEVSYDSKNQITVYINSPTTGKAYLN
jgi:hypothetical protein